MGSHEHAEDDGKVHAHISSVGFYIGILMVLLVLTGLTYALGQVHLGSANLFLAIVIATVKAALVATFFMHLKWDDKFNTLLFVGSVLFGGVFLVYTMNDTGHRARIDVRSGAKEDVYTGKAPGGQPVGWGEPVRASGASHGEH